jgi:hypothetical protein
MMADCPMRWQFQPIDQLWCLVAQSLHLLAQSLIALLSVGLNCYQRGVPIVNSFVLSLLQKP